MNFNKVFQWIGIVSVSLIVLGLVAIMSFRSVPTTEASTQYMDLDKLIAKVDRYTEAIRKWEQSENEFHAASDDLSEFVCSAWENVDGTYGYCLYGHYQIPWALRTAAVVRNYSDLADIQKMYVEHLSRESKISDLRFQIGSIKSEDAEVFRIPLSERMYSGVEAYHLHPMRYLSEEQREQRRQRIRRDLVDQVPDWAYRTLQTFDKLPASE